MNRKLWIFIPVLVLGLVMGFGGVAKAVVTPSPTLIVGGPGNGFPDFFSDGINVLELCLVGACAPTFNAGDPVNGPLEEAVYYSATAEILTSPGGERFLDIIAVEALNDPLAVPTQIVTNSQLIRLRNLQAGTYNIETPFGNFGPFVAAAGDDITLDLPATIGEGVPPDFAGTSAGPITIFASNGTGAPVQVPGALFGDGVSAAPLVGAGFGTGFPQHFRVTCSNCPIPVDITEPNFIVAGRLFAAPIPPVTSPARASYSRTATGGGNINVFATSPAANLQVLPPAAAPNLFTPTNMQTDNAGNFFVSIPVGAFPVPVPATVDVADGTLTLPALLNDDVTISIANFIPGTPTGILMITAASSDALATLAATGSGAFAGGALTGGALIDSTVAIPPPSVTVTSSGGGTDTALVNVLAPGAAGNITVTRAAFARRTGRLNLTGRGPAGAAITILGPGGQIGTATASARGAFRFAGPANIAAGNTLTLFTTGGAFATGVPVNVR